MKSWRKIVFVMSVRSRAAIALALFTVAGFWVVKFTAHASKMQAEDPTPAGYSKNENILTSEGFELSPAPTDRDLRTSVINAEFLEPRLLAYHASTNNLIISSGRPAKLELFSAKSRSAFGRDQLYSDRDEPRSIAAVREKNALFAAGEVFLGLDKGRILRVPAGGVETTTMKLPGESSAVDGGLLVDDTDAFGGNLIAATGTGRIWRIDTSGNIALLLDLRTSVRGLSIIPPDQNRYGWLAGKLLAGAPDQGGVYAVDADGKAALFPLNITTRDIDIVRRNENLFAVSTRPGKLLSVESKELAGLAGDILITPDGPGELHVLRWNGANFQSTKLRVEEEIGQVDFAPLSLTETGGCITSVTPAERVFQWEGGKGSFDVAAPVDCNWSAASNAPWLEIMSGASGTGNGTVTYSSGKNSLSTLRDANITVDGMTHRVRQSRKAQLQCMLSFDPPNPGALPATGGSGVINITGNTECAWEAVSDSPWLTINGNRFGSGNGSISFNASANFGPPRQASILFGRDSGSVAIDQSPNFAPTANAGPDQTIVLPSGASLSGTAMDDGVGNAVTVAWSKVSGPESVIFSGTQSLANTALFAAPGIYVLRLTASDGYLTGSDDVQITVNDDLVPPPPDPATIAPPIRQSVATNPFDSTKFLYTGPDAIQTGVVAGTIKEERVAILRGRVVNRAGAPVSKVRISILDHPEFGETRTRADGKFDMVVNGGGSLTVKYEKAGYIPIQRDEKAEWQDYEPTEDVVISSHNDSVSFIDLGSAAPIQVAEGTSITDASGTRRSRLFFKQGTSATMSLPGGSTQPLTLMNVRSTEFTVGPSGPETMPGDLPSLSAYTYASEYSVDEAVAVGATGITFSQPVVQYNENFLNFPGGTNIPSGAYDRESGIWMPGANGRVVKVLSITANAADLDLTGNGTPATDPEYAALGIDLAERQQLAALYVVNQSLWRVPVVHFSAWDSNWGFGPPPGSGPPSGGSASGGSSSNDGAAGGGPNGSCEKKRCIMGIEDQRLSEEVALVGTPFTLRYDSTRPRGNVSNYTARIPLNGPTLPGPVKRVEMKVTIAGQMHEFTFPPLPDQITTFTWDGKDAFGRDIQGQQEAIIDTSNVYDGVYQNTPFFGNFGNGVPVTGSLTRQELNVHRIQRVMLGSNTAPPESLGGWSLSEHHSYDPIGQKLYEGNGAQRSIQTVANGIDAFSGGLTGYLDGPIDQARFNRPAGITTAPDGIIYVADSNNQRVRKIAPDGTVSTFAGNGGGCNPANFPCGAGGPATLAQIGAIFRVGVERDGSILIGGGRNIWRVTADGILHRAAGLINSGFSGDGGPAVDARLSDTSRPFPAPDGSIYITDQGNFRIRRIDPNGIITTIAGTGIQGFSGDGGPATEAQIGNTGDLAIASDGSIYFTEMFPNNRIRRVGPDGIISTYAGTGVFGNSGDGGPASQATLAFETVSTPLQGTMIIGPDDSLYVVSFNVFGGGRIRRIDRSGIITGAAGNGVQGPQGDGGPATQAPMNLMAIAIGPDNSIYTVGGGIGTDWDESKIRKVSPPLPGFDGTALGIPSEDGTRLFQFDEQGRHLSTVNTLTGQTVLTFSYDAEGRLITVVDGDNNTTTIERDGSGNPTGILSPYNQRTTLTRDANGYLASIENPAGDTYEFTYNAGGQMLTEQDPRNNVSTFTYDAMGRLTRDDDPATGFQTLTRTNQIAGFTVTHNNALGRQSVFQTNHLATGDRQRTNTFPDGTQTTLLERGSGITTTTEANGMVTNETRSGDPRWKFQAPITSSLTVGTPGGLNYNATTARTATLATPGDPLSLVTQTDTFNINGRIRTSVFTAATRTFARTSAENRQSRTVIDTQGRLSEFQFADLNTTSFAYDTRGRLSGATFGSGGSARTFNLGYDAGGFRSSMTNPLNQTTSSTYDLAGRETLRTLPDSRTIAYGYDAKGNRTSLMPPGRPAHTFTYTAVDLLATYTAPNLGGSSTTTFTYNTDRDLTRINRPDGLQIDYAYDTGGRLQTVTVPNGNYAMAYSPTTGMLDNITAPGGGNLAFQYDGSLKTRETWTGTIAGNVSQTFDNTFRLASQSINGANTITYTYDNDDYLTAVGSLTLTRDPLNGLLKGSTLGSVSDVSVYNGFREPTAYTAQFNTSTLYNVGYTYDKLGRITQKVETVLGTTTTYAYGYDSSGRLTTVTVNGAPTPLVTYSYDSNDNRASIDVGGNVTTGTYDAQDRVTQYGTATYSYTQNGELQSKTDGASVTQYGYDVVGNLRNVTLPNATAIEYLIDGHNRRIGKRVNGTLTQGLLYQDQLEPVAELDGANNIVSRFVYGARPNTPEYMIKAGITYRIIVDKVGSVRLVVDAATGAVAQRIDYDEFGVILLDTNPGFQPFGFAGGIYDPQTGLTRFGARDYDAGTGRWTAKDPILFAGGSENLYAYVGNDPVNVTDPSGYNNQKIATLIADLTKMLKELEELLNRVKNPCTNIPGLGGRIAVLIIAIEALYDVLQHIVNTTMDIGVTIPSWPIVGPIFQIEAPHININGAGNPSPGPPPTQTWSSYNSQPGGVFSSLGP